MTDFGWPAWFHLSPESLSAYGQWGLAAVLFAESFFLPVPPEPLLVPLLLADPGHARRYALICTVASTLGGWLGHQIGSYAGRPLLLRFARPQRVARVEGMFARWGAWAVAIASFTPIPYKVFTIAAGVFRMNVAAFLLASLLSRGARFFLEAALVVRWGGDALQLLSRMFEPGALAVAVGAAGLAWVAARTARSGCGFARAARIPLAHGRTGVAASLLVSGVVFVKLAEDLRERGLGPFDARITRWLQAPAGPAMDAAMRGITALGSPFVLVPLVAVVAVYLFRREHAVRAAVLLSAASAGAWVADELLKLAFHRARPTWRFRWVIPAAAAVLVLLIAWSRVYLGVHYPSDVAAGIAAGGVWLTGAIMVLERMSTAVDPRV